jgi:hypothetical protein
VKTAIDIFEFNVNCHRLAASQQFGIDLGRQMLSQMFDWGYFSL